VVVARHVQFRQQTHPRKAKEDAVVPRIAWVDEESATGPVADLYAEARARAGLIPDIAKTFSGRPEALQGMMALCAVHSGPMLR
jgi:UTP:GlnB (protein PII) uridylyltransferase